MKNENLSETTGAEAKNIRGIIGNLQVQTLDATIMQANEITPEAHRLAERYRGNARRRRATVRSMLSRKQQKAIAMVN